MVARREFKDVGLTAERSSASTALRQQLPFHYPLIHINHSDATTDCLTGYICSGEVNGSLLTVWLVHLSHQVGCQLADATKHGFTNKLGRGRVKPVGWYREYDVESS
eukprot:6988859-Pyramimonas_sp.AAC.1